jgi:tetratricopeptide (TPR) repeat protein
MYINSATQPLFKVYNYAETDKTMPVAAYWSVYCGYKLKDPKATLHHTYLALKDTTHYNLMLQYLAETYKLENDTLRYIETLHEGFEKYPKFPFFFPRLVEYYADNGMWKDAMRVCEMAMNIDSTDVVYRFATSNVYLNTGKYRECIEICDKLIAENDSLTEAYFNAGLGYFNQAIELDKANKVSNKRRQHILDFYKKALPYLQKYRELLPDRKDKWSLPLYTIYLNLNMGKEFDEIDKLIREERK